MEWRGFTVVCDEIWCSQVSQGFSFVCVCDSTDYFSSWVSSKDRNRRTMMSVNDEMDLSFFPLTPTLLRCFLYYVCVCVHNNKRPWSQNPSVSSQNLKWMDEKSSCPGQAVQDYSSRSIVQFETLIIAHTNHLNPCYYYYYSLPMNLL